MPKPSPLEEPYEPRWKPSCRTSDTRCAACAAHAAAAAQVLSSVLYVGPVDAASFALAFGVLAAVALLANAVPARRAARVDPMIALREE